MTTFNREAAVDRLHQIHQRFVEMSGKHRFSSDDNAEFAQLQQEHNELMRQVQAADLRADADVVASAASGGHGLRLDTGSDPYSDERRGSSPQRSAAMRQLERSVKGGLPAAGAETLERLLETGPEHEKSWTARYITDSGSDEYKSAFAKIICYGEARAGLEWSPAERQAWEKVSRLKQEQSRALSLSDSAGGFLTPFEIDFAVNIVNAGSVNPLLSIARVVNTVSDVYHTISSAGVVASWDAEASEVSDDSPSFAESAVPNFKAAAFVPWSIEAGMDSQSLVTEVGRLVNDGLAQLLAVALVSGSGTGMPTGIITALSGGSSVVAAATADTVAATDVYALQSSLGPRWQPNARWCANLAILNVLRQLESGNGSLLFPELRATQPSLLGRPVHELSNMSPALAGGAGNNPVLLYGDFENFLISQRIGSAVELIPHLFSPNNLRPTGQRGMYAYARYGADSINDAAFRLLQA